VLCLAANPEETMLAYGDSAGEAFLMAAESKEVLRVFRVKGESVRRVGFLRGGLMVAGEF
jgi:hypothetical protein